MTTPSQEMLLKIRSLIADKEFEIALANRELQLGGWITDHQHSINCIEFEIEKLFQILNTRATSPTDLTQKGEGE